MEKKETEEEKIAFPEQFFLYECVVYVRLKPNRSEAYNNKKDGRKPEPRKEKKRRANSV
jgi:hypothetical protein